jgi:hypothetical protein
MGLMKHEAVALDPGTGIAYLTEDSKPRSGFYRYLPEDRSGRPGSLEQGGRLEMLRIRDHAGSDLREPREGRRLAVDWVPIGEPDADPESFVYATPALPPIVGAGRSGPFMQGEAAGGATFGRLEGCWYHQGAVYFTDTIGGRAETGCVWAYVPAEESLVAVHVSAGEHESDHVDNLTVSPDGLIVVCEDGAGRRDMLGRLTGGTRLLVVDAAGGVAALAENHVVLERSPQGRPLIAPGDYRDQEWCGACFSPDGETLFANVQTPGITVAIRGPWERFRYAG